MSTDGLKAELVIRLQGRLDEEEFGLAEAPDAAAAAPAAEGAKETPKKEAPKAPAPVAEKKPETTEEKTEEKPTEEAKKPDAEGKKPDPEGEKPESAAAAAPVAKKVSAGMSFEEKKLARAARFKMPVVRPEGEKKKQTSSQKKRKSGGRGRDDRDTAKGGRGSGGGNSDSSKRQKTAPVKKNEFEGLSKDELEKRLERANKYSVANNKVDAMKAALRKLRFESK